MSDLGRALFAYFKQILWALFLVYIILAGVAYLFGKHMGYDVVLWVCLGIAILIAVTFLSIYLLDSLRIVIGEWVKRFTQRHGSHSVSGSYLSGGSHVKRIIKTADAPQAIGPYSQGVEAGGFVFVSGQIPIDPKTGGVIQADIKDQTKRVMENAKHILAAAGCEMSSVVKSTIYLKNMTDFAAVNEIYGSYFPSDPPARATVEVSRLPKDVAVEIEFVAWKGVA